MNSEHREQIICDNQKIRNHNQILSDLTEIELLVNNLQSTITKPMRLKNKDIQLKSSIGYALYPQHGNDLASLFEHVDRAMYEIKHLRQRFNSKTSS